MYVSALDKSGIHFKTLLTAPPSYAEIVTEEQRQGRLDAQAVREELEGPLLAYIHEFRFQPPPLYSEVSSKKKKSFNWLYFINDPFS